MSGELAEPALVAIAFVKVACERLLALAVFPFSSRGCGRPLAASAGNDRVRS